MNWKIKDHRGNVIVLDTRASYFDWQMGDRVTIIFDAEKILINSICDPATKASLLGAGRHRHNIRTIVDELTRASC